MKKRIILLFILSILLFISNLIYGSIAIPIQDVFNILLGNNCSNIAWQHIIIESRLPQTITAFLAGSSLAISGLLLQTLFRNPLAGPSILGISNGANLGVAFIMLFFGSSIGWFSNFPLSGYVVIILAALLGAGMILSLILFFAAKVKNNVMLLIIGIMIGYLTSSFISILNFQSSSDKIHAFVLWGMGDFSNVSLEKLPYFSLFSIIGIIMSLLLIKPLNALLLGERYAENLGVHIKHIRMLILFCTGLLTATATAFCGPIAFIGLAVPHMARLLLGSSNHTLLLPITLLCGACIALLCNMFTTIPGTSTMLPLNAITPIIGAPVIIYVIINRRNIQYFN